MNRRQLILKQLERQLELWRQVGKPLFQPKIGWIKTIRQGLGMTANQLAKRLSVHRTRVVKIERAELEGALTLRTLREAAESLNCDLIYGFVPKESIQETLQKQAEKVARQRIKGVAHSMALEDQSVTQRFQEEQIKELAKELLLHAHRHLWEEK